MINLIRNKKIKRTGISGTVAILSLIIAIATVTITTTAAAVVTPTAAAATTTSIGVAKPQTLRVGSVSFVNGITITGITSKTPSIETITLTKTGSGSAPSLVLGILDRDSGKVGSATVKGGWTNSKSVDVKLTNYDFLRNPQFVRVIALPLTSQD